MSFNTFKPNPSRTTIIPQNYKKGPTVREYVEYYADSHKLKMDQALAVQGVDSIIWNRTYTNRYCTCQGLDSVINNNPAVTDNTRPEVIKYQKELEIQKLNNRQKNTNIVSKTLVDNGLESLADLVNAQYEESVETDLPVEPIVKVQKKQNSIIEEALQLQQENLGVEFSDLVSCPICFSTRHTDSYQPYRGSRIILDASDYYSLQTNGVFVNKDNKPYTLDFNDANAYVVWTVELPTYFNVDSIRMFNLEHQSTSFNLDFKQTDDVSYIPLTADNLKARNGMRNSLDIKVSINANNITKNLQDVKLQLTHVELILRFTDDYEKIELPALEIPENVDYVELYLRSRAVLSPRVENIGRNSLICESKYGRIWEITNLVKNFTARGNLVSLRADTRLIQNSEKLFNLNIFPTILNTIGMNYSK